MKVFHFYSGNRLGGVEVLLLTLQKLQGRFDGGAMQPLFGLCWDGPLAAWLREAGARLSMIRPARFTRPWTVVRARADLRHALLAERPDVVVCHEFWNYALAAPVVRRLGLPLVIWHHSPPEGNWLEWSVRLRRPDLAIACSRYVASKLHALESAERIRYYYAPFPAVENPPRTREDIRTSAGVKADEIVICFIGRLSAYKGQAELLDALALLKDLPVQAWITAAAQSLEEATFLASLKSRCHHHGIDSHVRFFERFESAHDLYMGADIYCQPNSGPEPYGFTFLEALSAGLPVVSTEIGGALEILRGDSMESGEDFGVLVPPRDARALAQALRLLIQDAGRRERNRARGRVRAREFADPAVAMPRLASLLNEAVGFHQSATQ